MSHPDPPTRYSSSASSTASAELKLYQAFIFSVPIFFTFILLFLFYLLYLRRRRADWSALRMRNSLNNNNHDISRAELGLKKELREMLPIIIYKESFSIKDTQCSVCLADYQAEDKLQQIPACGHAFHMDCIDSWLATHSTCPLCRLSLAAKVPSELPDIREEPSLESSVVGNSDGTSDQARPQTCEETRVEQEEGSSQCVEQEAESSNGMIKAEEHEHGSRGIPA